MRPKPDCVHLVGALVIDPGLDEVRREDATRLEEVVVGLESVHRLFERRRHLADLGELLGRHVEEVVVDRVRRLGLVRHAVQPRHEDR